MDNNIPAHPRELEVMHPNALRSYSKLFYIRWTLKILLETTECDIDMNAGKIFIFPTVLLTKKSLQELKSYTMKECGKKTVVYDDKSVQIQKLTENTTQLVNIIERDGFEQ